MRDLILTFIVFCLSFIFLLDVWAFIISIINQDSEMAIKSSIGLSVYVGLWFFIELQSRKDKE